MSQALLVSCCTPFRPVIHLPLVVIPSVTSATMSRLPSAYEECRKQMIERNKKVHKEAETTVLEVFPRKIMLLDNAIEAGDYVLQDYLTDTAIDLPVPPAPGGDVSVSGSEDSRDSCVILFPKGEVKTNRKIEELWHKILPLLKEQRKFLYKIKFGVSVLVPKIEDGNNFGVEVQEKFTKSLAQIETQCANDWSMWTTYADGRKTLVIAISKYPHCEDARKSLAALEESVVFRLELMAQQIRDRYVAIYDQYTKNMEKIVQPRGNEPRNFY